VIDLSERTVNPDFIDTHVHLTMAAASLALQTLQSSAPKAVLGDPGFDTRDLKEAKALLDELPG
jgi:imidazolonepropionase-like amidohydrolase